MLHRLKNNNKGVVLITVTVIVLLLMLLVAAIINMNVSQIKLTQDEYKRIQNQILAESTLALVYADQQTGSPTMNDTFSVNLDGINHSISYTILAGGLLGSSVVDIDITY